MENRKMNKDKVEFEFNQHCSPLRRNHLRESIKEIVTLKAINQNKSKEQIIDYLINAVQSTTNSIKNFYSNRKNRDIDEILAEYHNTDEYQEKCETFDDKKYIQIAQNDKKKTAYIIKENSDIRKDNYSVMFESIYIAINEIINPKKKKNRITLGSVKVNPQSVTRVMGRNNNNISEQIKLKNDLLCNSINEEEYRGLHSERVQVKEYSHSFKTVSHEEKVTPQRKRFFSSNKSQGTDSSHRNKRRNIFRKGNKSTLKTDSVRINLVDGDYTGEFSLE